LSPGYLSVRLLPRDLWKVGDFGEFGEPGLERLRDLRRGEFAPPNGLLDWSTTGEDGCWVVGDEGCCLANVEGKCELRPVSSLG